MRKERVIVDRMELMRLYNEEMESKTEYFKIQEIYERISLVLGCQVRSVDGNLRHIKEYRNFCPKCGVERIIHKGKHDGIYCTECRPPVSKKIETEETGIGDTSKILKGYFNNHNKKKESFIDYDIRWNSKHRGINYNQFLRIV